MTEPLSIKDLNCSTCTNDKCYHHPQHFRKVCLWSEADHKKVWEFTKGYGAICHPLALQVLAAPVIAELERQHADLIDIELHTPESHNDVVNDSYKADGIQISINILKGGA